MERGCRMPGGREESGRPAPSTLVPYLNLLFSFPLLLVS